MCQPLFSALDVVSLIFTTTLLMGTISSLYLTDEELRSLVISRGYPAFV